MLQQNLWGIVKEKTAILANDARYEIYRSDVNADPAEVYDLGDFLEKEIIIQGTLVENKIYNAAVFLRSAFNPGPAPINNRMGTTLKPNDKKNPVNWRGKWSFVYSIEPAPEENPPWNSPINRDPAALLKIIQFLDVENTPRYQARDGWTCCTIFVSDVTRLMHCEIPLDPMGATKWYNRGANKMIEWVEKIALAKEGWCVLDSAEEAQKRANLGYPVVGIMRASGSPGHVVMVIPGTLDENGVPHTAQAGLHNFSSGRWTHPSIRYITHE